MNIRLAPPPHDKPAAAPGRILVVDDHQQARESVAFTLRQAGHTVVCLSSAVEGLKRLEREPVDVVITDLKMPGMTGLEFLAELKKRKSTAQVIVVTAYATVATAVVRLSTCACGDSGIVCWSAVSSMRPQYSPVFTYTGR